jgi:glycine/D-amino acid oxidase-like deaminating enzyme
MNGNPLDHGLWGVSAPAAPPTNVLASDIIADVVIVGGGFTGFSAAYHLASIGVSAVVLEAREIGFGGSGRNVGLVNAGLWVMPDDLLATLGDRFGERLLAQLGEAPRLVFDLVDHLGIDCEAVPHGTLHCAVGSKGLAEISERARQWQARGADVELIDARGAECLIGSSAYAGALLDRRAGTIQPLAYARGLADHAMRAGARVHTRSPAIQFSDLGTAWKVTTPEGSVAAPWVILATDAYSEAGCPDLKREQIMLPYFNLATRPLSDAQLATILPERHGAWDTKSILSSFRLDAGGRLVFGSVGALRRGGKRIHIDWGKRELARLFPQLGAVDFEHGWYGQIGMTDNAMPRLHRHGRKMVSISGFNGRGIAPGTTFGRDLARLASGQVALEDLSLPLTGAQDAPFRAVRSAFYEAGAQIAHLTGAHI